jgi:uncharacterized MnhB-related membrane protein
MTVGLVLDLVLVTAVLVSAGLALFVPGRVASVMMFLVFGLVLAVVWARLGAPDVALAEAAIAAGVTGALLLDAVTERPRRGPDRRVGPRWLMPLLGAVAGAGLVVLLGAAALQAGPVEPGTGLGPTWSPTGRRQRCQPPGHRRAPELPQLRHPARGRGPPLAVLAALSLQPRREGSRRCPRDGDASPSSTRWCGCSSRWCWWGPAGCSSPARSRPGGAFQAGAVLAGGAAPAAPRRHGPSRRTRLAVAAARLSPPDWPRSCARLPDRRPRRQGWLDLDRSLGRRGDRRCSRRCSPEHRHDAGGRCSSPTRSRRRPGRGSHGQGAGP